MAGLVSGCGCESVGQGAVDSSMDGLVSVSGIMGECEGKGGFLATCTQAEPYMSCYTCNVHNDEAC